MSLAEREDPPHPVKSPAFALCHMRIETADPVLTRWKGRYAVSYS